MNSTLGSVVPLAMFYHLISQIEHLGDRCLHKAVVGGGPVGGDWQPSAHDRETLRAAVHQELLQPRLKLQDVVVALKQPERRSQS